MYVEIHHSPITLIVISPTLGDMHTIAVQNIDAGASASELLA